MVLLWKILIAMSLVGSVSAKDKVVYGNDDRLDVFEVGDSLLLELARSTAGQIDWSELKKERDGSYKMSVKTLEGRGICKSQRYADQPTAANCSGFLVGADLLVTAGHCMRSKKNCKDAAWVFDYAITSVEDEALFKAAVKNKKVTLKIKSEQVFGCKEIVEQTLETSTQNDYALVRLDRKVEGRRSLVFRTEGKLNDKADLVVIGHPTGLPTKVAAGAFVRDNSNGYYFVSNLDTFGGNSGSAVFDVKTGIVEGILVRGENDYINSQEERGCKVVNKCEDKACRGEDVTRITNVKKLMALASELN